MAYTITVTLRFDEQADPPVRLSVQRDSHTVADRALTAEEGVATLRTLAPDVPEIWAPAEAIVTHLQAAVEQGAKEQAARKKVLAAWQKALGDVDTAPAPQG